MAICSREPLFGRTSSAELCLVPPVQVKICGITNRDDAMAAVDAGAAAVGLNFYPHSPRRVDIRVAAEIVHALPGSVCTVGVFVDAARAQVEAIGAHVALAALQFHGSEPPELCVGWTGKKVIKALRVRDPHAAVLARRYGVDFILADAYVEGQFGGTGQRIASDLLTDLDRTRLILAGGLTADNVAEAVRAVRPFAVDVASGVERAPGRKDWDLMRRFIANARSA
jgi:phosphoribosylanthranilate isomerase